MVERDSFESWGGGEWGGGGGGKGEGRGRETLGD
jgi:hypothetical protein